MSCMLRIVTVSLQAVGSSKKVAESYTTPEAKFQNRTTRELVESHSKLLSVEITGPALLALGLL